MAADSEQVSVFITPPGWQETFLKIREAYKETVDEYNLILSKRTNNKEVRKLVANRAIIKRLHNAVETYLPKIGQDFCTALEVTDGFRYERMGTMAVSKIAYGKQVRATESDRNDDVHSLLLLLREKKPRESILIDGIKEWVRMLSLEPRNENILTLVNLCNQYMRGKEHGVFTSIVDTLSNMKPQFSDMDGAINGSCYFIEKPSVAGNGGVGFQFALLLPAFMYTFPCLETGFIGEKGYGLLDPIVKQYGAAGVASTEDFERLSKTVNPMHLAPIVGTLPSKQAGYFKQYIPHGYNALVSAVDLRLNRGNIYYWIKLENIFDSLDTFPAPRLVGQKPRVVLRTLDSFFPEEE